MIATRQPGSTGLTAAALVVFSLSAPCAHAQWTPERVGRRAAFYQQRSFRSGRRSPIAFGDERLRLARGNGAGWTFEDVAPAVCGAWYPSLALDAAGLPLIAYRDDNLGAVRLARFDGAAWSLETVDPAGGSHISLALDAAGRPYDVYIHSRSGVHAGRKRSAPRT